MLQELWPTYLRSPGAAASKLQVAKSNTVVCHCLQYCNSTLLNEVD